MTVSKFKVEMKFSRGWDDAFTSKNNPTIFESKQEAEDIINHIIGSSSYLLRKDFRIKTHEGTNKEIKNILETQEVKFTIKGITQYTKDDKGNWGYFPKVFKTEQIEGKTEAIFLVGNMGMTHSMNIEKFYPTTFTLYTFDILGNQTKGRVRYQDVTIIQE